VIDHDGNVKLLDARRELEHLLRPCEVKLEVPAERLTRDASDSSGAKPVVLRKKAIPAIRADFECESHGMM
jgi:hypothetical protein